MISIRGRCGAAAIHQRRRGGRRDAAAAAAAAAAIDRFWLCADADAAALQLAAMIDPANPEKQGREIDGRPGASLTQSTSYCRHLQCDASPAVRISFHRLTG